MPASLLLCAGIVLLHNFAVMVASAIVRCAQPVVHRVVCVCLLQLNERKDRNGYYRQRERSSDEDEDR